MRGIADLDDSGQAVLEVNKRSPVPFTTSPAIVEPRHDAGGWVQAGTGRGIRRPGPAGLFSERHHVMAARDSKYESMSQRRRSGGCA